MRRLMALAWLLVGCALGATAQVETLSSPDGRYLFSFSMEDGRMTYAVDYDGQTVVERGDLGVEIDNGLLESALGMPRDTTDRWASGLLLTSTQRTETDQVWTPLYGENAQVRDHYNQLTLCFAKGLGGKQDFSIGYDKRMFYLMNLEVRAYDEGIAFRYYFPEATNGLFLNVMGERTSMTMPEGTTALYEEWAQGPFEWRSLTKAARYPNARGNAESWKECERPLYLQLANGLKVVLTEAGMRDYARGKFVLDADNVLRVKLFDGVQVISPYATPWRVVMAARRAVDLINNKDILLNLNAPCELQQTDFIRPGKVFRCCRLEKSFIMDGIRFARQQGLQYIELDAGWYGPEMSMTSSALKEAPNRNFTIKEVCDSARRQGLGVWVYVNQRALYKELDAILPLFREWGVSGVKFGFVQVGNQMWSTWLHNAVRKCADYGLMVDIHDEYRPTGISRTLPNLMTQEGIGGNEEMPDAEHNTILPFTRFIAGAADYTPCYYSERVKNTHAHQLAMAAVYYSPIQFLFWYDNPQVFDGGRELKFWKDIPTVFDESKALDGEPGEFIVQARRRGDDWFVGILNGMTARTVTLSTADFLPKGKYTVELYTDDASLKTRSKVASRTQTVRSGQKITLPLQASGGAALHFYPIK